MSAIRIGVAGLGYWGPNLARNFAGATRLRARVALRRRSRRPRARGRAVPGHAAHGRPGRPARRSRARRRRAGHAGADARARWPSACCGPASTASSRSRSPRPSRTPSARVAAAEETGRTLMVGHLLEYHPGVIRLKEIADGGELGEIHYIYSNRLNLGKLRADENALWSLGAHDVSVVLHLAGEEPYEVEARGESYMRPGIEDVVFALPALPVGPRRPPAPVLARPAQGAPLHGRRLAPDGDVRRHGPRAQGHRLRQGVRPVGRLLGRVHHPVGRHPQPGDPEPRAAAARVRALRRLPARRARAALGRPLAGCGSCASWRRCRTASTPPAGSSVRSSDRAPGLVLGATCGWARASGSAPTSSSTPAP